MFMAKTMFPFNDISIKILSTDGDYDERLVEFLLSHSKSRRPVLSIKDNVTVQFGITLNQIIDVVCIMIILSCREIVRFQELSG